MEGKKITANVVTVFCRQNSTRLSFLLDWLLGEVLHLDYKLVQDEHLLPEDELFLSYGKVFRNAVSVPDSGLLWEKGIYQRKPEQGIWQDLPTFFPADGAYTVSFDLFSAIFYLLTRYEEYEAKTTDKHGRYPAHESILCECGLLRRPIVDEWIAALTTLLQKLGVDVLLTDFRATVSYDIDIAFSYRHKGFVRSLGAAAKDVLKGNYVALHKRMNVLLSNTPDPYDCFAWLSEQHRKNGIHPHYFVLAAKDTTDYDKNIDPNAAVMRQLITSFAREGTVGMHPSYFSIRPETFDQEKLVLEQHTGHLMTHSRQHYIRLRLPDTYRMLMSFGIKEDWSMGYGSRLGFRAGTGRSFFWYDVALDQQTTLRIHPFCFMDSTAHFEEKLTVEAAFAALAEMQELLRKTNSHLVTVFHNFSLGTDPQWKGWREAYANFLAVNAEYY